MFWVSYGAKHTLLNWPFVTLVCYYLQPASPFKAPVIWWVLSGFYGSVSSRHDFFSIFIVLTTPYSFNTVIYIIIHVKIILFVPDMITFMILAICGWNVCVCVRACEGGVMTERGIVQPVESAMWSFHPIKSIVFIYEHDIYSTSCLITNMH